MTEIQSDTLDPEQVKALQALYGVRYVAPEAVEVLRSRDSDTYTYTVYTGHQLAKAEPGDSLWCVVHEKGEVVASVVPGPAHAQGSERGVIVSVRGYAPPPTITRPGKHGTVLPYVNGCSTRQLIPPPRPGDPTLQLLAIPPFSAEQAHHVHATARVAYVLSGKGVSVVGMEGALVKTELLPGMICVLDPMCPHHFETPQGEWLLVIPLHVWSSPPGGIEYGHPMMAGTFRTG